MFFTCEFSLWGSLTPLSSPLPDDLNVTLSWWWLQISFIPASNCMQSNVTRHAQTILGHLLYYLWVLAEKIYHKSQHPYQRRHRRTSDLALSLSKLITPQPSERNLQVREFLTLWNSLSRSHSLAMISLSFEISNIIKLFCWSLFHYNRIRGYPMVRHYPSFRNNIKIPVSWPL